MATASSETVWEDMEIVQDVFCERKNFKTKVQMDARPRMRRTLEKKGWKKSGEYWVSPYTHCRYTERGALDVECLRGTFEAEYREKARKRNAGV